MIGGRLVRVMGAFFLPLALAATGCGNGTFAPGNAGLEVTVHKGPLQPVVMEGEENSEPVSNALVEVRAFGRTARYTTRTDGFGKGIFYIQPGGYIVTVLECGEGLVLPAPETVTIQNGAISDLYFECDTGIR